MKKEIYYCDTCGKKNKTERVAEQDLCRSCINARIRHSLSLETDFVCSSCNGSGLTEEWTGVGSDYNSEHCRNCNTTGIDKNFRKFYK